MQMLWSTCSWIFSCDSNGCELEKKNRAAAGTDYEPHQSKFDNSLMLVAMCLQLSVNQSR